MNLPNPQTDRGRAKNTGGLQRAVQLILRLGAALVAFALMLGALMLGLVLALVVIIWAVVRGRKPVVGVFRSTYRRARQGTAGPSAGQVVDVEAREVPENPSR